MAIRIVPNEIKAEVRSLMIKYGFITAVLLFVAISLGDYAVYQWIIGGYGLTIIFGLISFGFVVLSLLILMQRVAKHEADLKHSPEKIQFWVDLELLDSGFMTMDEFISRHGTQVMRINKNLSDYVESRKKTDKVLEIKERTAQ